MIRLVWWLPQTAIEETLDHALFNIIDFHDINQDHGSDSLMSTSDDQQSQIAELRADIRVLEANFTAKIDVLHERFTTQQHKFDAHENKTDAKLIGYKFWIAAGGAGIALLFLVASVATIFSQPWS